MKKSDFTFELPQERIAQKSAHPRDHSRLMVLDTQTGSITHRSFFDIENYLQPGDVLVLNNSKVIPARLSATKQTGGKVEIFLVRELTSNTWTAMLKGVKEKEAGKKLFISPTCWAIPIKKTDDVLWHVQFNKNGQALRRVIQKFGSTPTPPYIKKMANLKDYQTVYAKHEGSVAAPTAGLHFTTRLINRLKKKGVTFCSVTLHVGPGTFAPLRTEDISKHIMHAEWAHIDKKTAQEINKAKKESRRIIAVGTTSVRTLESFSHKKGVLQSGTKEVNIFITPGYRFNMIDGLITNFHLPESTLLMLVCAFAEYKNSGGMQFILNAYREAIQKKYRFYSFGDAMVIL